MAGGMTDSPQRFDEVAFPALLRGARTAYAGAIQAALAGAECGDLPRNGSFVLGAIARHGLPLSEIIGSSGYRSRRQGSSSTCWWCAATWTGFPIPATGGA